jgi:hypothetical protein
VTHAIVLLQADRSALATLGGDLADIDGVAEAYSVTVAAPVNSPAVERARSNARTIAG